MGWKKDKFIAPKGQAPDSSQAYPYPCVRFEGPVCLTLGLQPKLLSAILIMASLKCRTRKMVKSAVSVYQLDCPSNTLLWLARKMEKQNFAKPELQKQ